MQKLNDYFGHHGDFIQIKNNSSSFGISHFAGKVKYDVYNFLNQSKDFLSKNIIECLQKSDDHFVADLFSNLPSPTGCYSNIRARASNIPFKTFASKPENESSKQSLSYEIAQRNLERCKNTSVRYIDQNYLNAINLIYFNVSLNEIISIVENAKPVFVKCIKPNENSFSNQFVSTIAIRQVRDAGLVEYARVRKFNYPVKLDFRIFLSRFENLAKMNGLNMETANNFNVKEVCIRVLQQSGIRNFRIGANKIFLKNEDLDILERDQLDSLVSNKASNPNELVQNKNLAAVKDSNNFQHANMNQDTNKIG